MNDRKFSGHMRSVHTLTAQALWHSLREKMFAKRAERYRRLALVAVRVSWGLGTWFASRADAAKAKSVKQLAKMEACILARDEAAHAAADALAPAEEKT